MPTDTFWTWPTFWVIITLVVMIVIAILTLRRDKRAPERQQTTTADRGGIASGRDTNVSIGRREDRQ